MSVCVQDSRKNSIQMREPPNYLHIEVRLLLEILRFCIQNLETLSGTEKETGFKFDRQRETDKQRQKQKERTKGKQRVLHKNHNGDWAAFLHPDVLTEMYVKNFITSYTIYAFYSYMYNATYTSWQTCKGKFSSLSY